MGRSGERDREDILLVDLGSLLLLSSVEGDEVADSSELTSGLGVPRL